MLKAFAGGVALGERWGDGPPRVLGLHGWGRARADLAPALRELDAVAIDLPGFGSTPPPPEPWGAREYASHLLPVLDELEAPVVLVGHSFGGRVAVCLAATAGGRVGALVLAGVPLVRRDGGPRRPPLGYRAVRALRRLGLVGEERLERARRRHGSADYLRAQGVMRAVLVRVVGESYETELAALTCPVELVWGEHDHEVPVGVAERARAHLRDGRLTVVPGAGHDVVLEAPDVVRGLVEAHLR